jgi:1-acyl-sn-glycerol-3-phosphate acyltransferase
MGDHVIDIGARVPRTRHPVLRWIAQHLLSLLGWRLDIHLPDEPRLVVLAAPHTSNWDGVLAVLTIFALELRLGLFVKHSAFETRLIGGILRKAGAIAIDRRAPGGVIGQTVDAFKARPELLIGLAPEGTRKRVDKWKRGFHLIAMEAQVPIICAYMDYRRKVIGTGLLLERTGSYEQDLEKIQTFYRTITPRLPENFNASG